MHWKAPTTMLAAFAIGVAFAIGHHFFYQSLDGTPLDSATFDQQINTAVGTAFAFLVRASLSVAIGVAFVQVLWRRLLAQSITVSRIDSMTQLLTSLFDLLNLKTLWQHPVLAVLAIISWTLPIAAVIPPASLSVRNPTGPRVHYEMRDIAMLDFALGSFATINQGDPVGGGFSFTTCFSGSTNKLAQLALGTAIAGEIPSRRAPAVNSSYTMQFFAPSIQCDEAPISVLSGFNSVFGCNIVIGYADSGCIEGYPDYQYLAWTPAADARVPFTNSSVTNVYALDFTHDHDGTGCSVLGTSGGFGSDPTTLYIGSHSQDGAGWSLLGCSLHNASYTTTFNYNEAVETIAATRHITNSLSYFDSNGFTHNESGVSLTEAQRVITNYQAVMDAFGKIMVGGIWDIVAVSGPGTQTAATSILDTKLSSLVQYHKGNSTTLLARTTEQLFENITLSLFSRPDYVSTNATNFMPTKVAISTYTNIYTYSWGRLALAYGLAVFFTAVAISIGGFALLASNESYQYTFSTIMRLTRQKAIDAMIRLEDTGSEDPLPKHIGKGEITAGPDADHDEGEQDVIGLDQSRHTMQEVRLQRPLTGDSDAHLGSNPAAQTLLGSDEVEATEATQLHNGDGRNQHASDPDTQSFVSSLSSANPDEDHHITSRLSRHPSDTSMSAEQGGTP